MEHIDFPKDTTTRTELLEAVQALSDFLPSPHSAREMIEFAAVEMFKLGFLLEKDQRGAGIQLVNKLNSWVGATNTRLFKIHNGGSPVNGHLVEEFVAAATAALHFLQGNEKNRGNLVAWVSKLQGRVSVDLNRSLENARAHWR